MVGTLISYSDFYTENLLPIGIILCAICILERITVRLLGYHVPRWHQLAVILFAAYLAVTFHMTVSLADLWHSWSGAAPLIRGGQMWRPFFEIRQFLKYGTPPMIVFNLVCNVLAFLPMGLFPPLIWRSFRHPLWAVWWWLLPSVVIELLQLFTPRSTSVDDVILNAFGGMLGYLLFWLIHLLGGGWGTTVQEKRGKRLR